MKTTRLYTLEISTCTVCSTIHIHYVVFVLCLLQGRYHSFYRQVSEIIQLLAQLARLQCTLPLESDVMCIAAATIAPCSECGCQC